MYMTNCRYTQWYVDPDVDDSGRQSIHAEDNPESLNSHFKYSTPRSTL